MTTIQADASSASAVAAANAREAARREAEAAQRAAVLSAANRTLTNALNTDDMSAPRSGAANHYEPPTEVDVGDPTNGAPEPVEPPASITLDPPDPVSGTANGGMPLEMTLEDDLTNRDLDFVKAVVHNAEAAGLSPSRNWLDGFQFANDVFSDRDFVEQAYDWADELEATNPSFSNDVRDWLTTNGAFDPNEPPPIPDPGVDNPPVQEIYDTPQEAIDANAVPTVGGQSVGEFSVLDLPSGVAIDPNNPAAGQLTVQEAAQQAQYIEYKNGIEAGTIPPDDPRAQFVNALEAKAALDGGYDLIATYERPGLIGNNSNQKYPEQGNANAGQNADGQITYEVGAADAAELINADAVNAQIETLWNDPTIQADFATHAQAVVDALPNKDALAAELSKAIESPEYLNALQDMAASGFAEEATQLTASNLSNLALLNPELATQAQTNLALSTVASELNGVLADPSLLDAESMRLAIKDSIELTIAGLRSGFGTIRHTTGTIDHFAAYAQGFANDPVSVKALSDTYKQLVIDAKNGLPVDPSNVSAAQFQSAMERAYIPAELRGGLTQFVAEAQNMGVWGTLSGGAMLASFGYKVANGAFDADSTATERWGAARDLISFGSVIGHVSKTGATVADSIRGMFGNQLSDAAQDALGLPPRVGNPAWQALGLDRTLPELFGTTSLLPNEMNWSQLWQSYNDTTGTPGTLSGAAQQALIDPTGNIQVGSSASSSSIDSAVAVVDDILKAKAPLTSAGTGTKIAGTVLKVVGTVTDLFGVADIVMGGIAAKQAAEAGDRPMAAVASLQAISGGFTAAAGALGTAALVAPLPAALAGAAAPLFLAGAAVAVVALVIMIGVSVHRKNERLQDNTADQGAFFQRLADQGLTQADWGDKLEYLRNAWSVYGNDNPDQNQSYFDYQHAEWEHFQNTAQAHGSSVNRLSADLHVSNDLTIDGRKDPETVSDWGNTEALVS